MRKTYVDLKKSVNEAEVSILNDTVKVVFGNNVLFDFGSARIKAEVFPAFKRFSDALNKHPETEILVCGYTDTVGGEGTNINLSQKRADSAKAMLVYNNVDDRRIFTWGLGFKNPVASNTTEEGRQQNRRVEFVILHNYKN
ncbi:OmpA family protein [Taibaiella soli]|nr:OmpA family protein [Taibaiella soli]